MLKPYPETTVEWIEKSQGTFAIHTPWIVVNAEVDQDAVAAVDEAITAINHGARSSQDMLNVHYFLSQFQEHPISYATPRHPDQFHDLRPLTVTLDQAKISLLSRGLQYPLVWSQEKVRELSQISGFELCDPVSVVGLVRRLRLQASYSHEKIQDQVRDLFLLKESHPQQLVKIMQRVLEHSLFITKHAVNVLKGSAGLYGGADSILQHFIASETGHDLLVLKSLKALGAVRQDWMDHLFDEVKTLMETLQYAAGKSLQSLAVLLEGYEGVRYDTEQGHIWDLLEDIPGYPQASGGVREHDRINDAHNHALICLDLAATLPPVTFAEVDLAVHLAEVSEHLRHQLFEKLYSAAGAE